MRTVVDAITASLGPAATLPATLPATLTVAGTGTTPDTCLSWVALHERARRMASVLAKRGIGPGSRVGLLADTSTGLVTAIQAVWLRGAAFTVLPLPGRTARQAHQAHLSAIAADANFDLLITGDGLGGGSGYGSGERLSDRLGEVSLSTLELEAAQAELCAVIRPDPDDLAVLQYTSGSTRNPRAVPVTHGNLAANLDAIEAAIGASSLDPATACWMSWLPLYHDMGLIGFLALPMSRGCPLVLQSPVSFALRPASWLERLSRHRATSTGAPNFAYGLMAQLLEAGRTADPSGDPLADPSVDLSSVRHMFSGGEPINAAMMARFAHAAGRRGLDPKAVVAAYGLAESTLAVSFSSIGHGITVDEVDREMLERDGQALPAAVGMTSRRLVRLGRAVSGTQIRIIGKTGAEVTERAVGHIEVSGTSVVGGGWLRTGDLGYLADGDLVLCGRAKDVLFAAGRNIYPQDVEAAAANVPGVRAGGAAAFGIPADLGDRLIVAVESRGVDSSELRKAVAIAVARETGMAPADVVPLRFGHLPRTSSGKLRRAETRRRYLSGELTGALMERSVQ